MNTYRIEEELKANRYLMDIYMKRFPEAIEDNFESKFEYWLEEKANEFNTDGVVELSEKMKQYENNLATI